MHKCLLTQWGNDWHILLHKLLTSNCDTVGYKHCCSISRLLMIDKIDHLLVELSGCLSYMPINWSEVVQRQRNMKTFAVVTEIHPKKLKMGGPVNFKWTSLITLVTSFFCRTFLEALINPLQEQMEEWKRGVYTLDKDHARGRNVIGHWFRPVIIITVPYRFVVWQIIWPQ